MSADSGIVAPNGRPARAVVSTACPCCGSPKAKRVPSCGFGEQRHDVCGFCGYEFEEFTCEEQ